MSRLKILSLLMMMLLAATSHAATNITGGNVSGTWAITGSPYVVDGDITIPAGETLVVEAGVTIEFQSWYFLMVTGFLEAAGTVAEPILFTAPPPGPGQPGWRGVRFVNAPDGSFMRHCIVEYGKVTAADPYDCGGGIYCENANPLISHTTIRNCRASRNGAGIYCRQSAPRIEYCTIVDNLVGYLASGGGAGIGCVDSAPEIVDTMISGNQVSVFGGFGPATGVGAGLYLYNSDAVVTRTVISENILTVSGNVGSSARGAAVYCRLSEPRFVNCTLAHNQAGSYIAPGEGGAFHLFSSEVVLVNSILWENSTNEIFCTASGGVNSVVAAFCDIMGGENGVVTNGHADITWDASNLDADPLFVAPTNGDFHLRGGSPCIDSGTAYFELAGEVIVDLNPADYNGSAPDQGAFEFGIVTGIDAPPLVQQALRLHPSYPNPFNPQTTISFELARAGFVNLEVYDVRGRLVASLMNGDRDAGHHEVVWSPRNLSSGMYFYTVTAGERAATGYCSLVK
jgi:hypothetical protein